MSAHLQRLAELVLSEHLGETVTSVGLVLIRTGKRALRDVIKEAKLRKDEVRMEIKGVSESNEHTPPMRNHYIFVRSQIVPLHLHQLQHVLCSGIASYTSVLGQHSFVTPFTPSPLHSPSASPFPSCVFSSSLPLPTTLSPLSSSPSFPSSSSASFSPHPQVQKCLLVLMQHGLVRYEAGSVGLYEFNLTRLLAMLHYPKYIAAVKVRCSQGQLELLKHEGALSSLWLPSQVNPSWLLAFTLYNFIGPACARVERVKDPLVQHCGKIVLVVG